MRFAKYPILVLGALVFAAGQALSERGRDAVSPSRAFSIDGKRFLVGEATAANRSVVDDELARRGIDPTRLARDVASVLGPGTVEPLREAPPPAPASPLPVGLTPDHVLRLETATGPVEIAFGRTARGDKDVLGQLRSRGWVCTETDLRRGVGAIAQLTRGKEASLVLFEKTEGRFLAVRRPSR